MKNCMAHYGILCSITDLEEIVKNLDKFIKKNKIATKGLDKKIGKKHGLGDVNSITCYFVEWELRVGIGYRASVADELGRAWHLDIVPNRHYKIDEFKDVGEVKEQLMFPNRKDIPFYITLIKYRHEDGNAILDDFYQRLFDCIGFPLELLHEYKDDEMYRFA